MTAEGQLRSELKLGNLLAQFPEFLALLGNAGPTPVAEAARTIGEQSPEQWTQLLNDFWTFGGRADSETEIENSGAEPLEEFVLRVFLQPHACGRKAMEESAACCVLSACRSGIFGEFIVRLAVRRTKKSCPCMWPNNFPTFAWKVATPANFICAPLI
jgi:hypothetical protein